MPVFQLDNIVRTVRLGSVCAASLAASAVASSDARARARLEDTGWARSSGKVSRPRSSTEEATSTKDGTTCLFLVLVTSGTAFSVLFPSEELEPPGP